MEVLFHWTIIYCFWYRLFFSFTKVLSSAPPSLAAHKTCNLHVRVTIINHLTDSTSAPPHPFLNTDNADMILAISKWSRNPRPQGFPRLCIPILHFKHLFLLPSNDNNHSLPIEVPESSLIWESLLRLCYRLDDPSFQNMQQIRVLFTQSSSWKIKAGELNSVKRSGCLCIRISTRPFGTS